MAAGYDDSDLFEFIEILNINESTEIDLSGASFTNGVTFTFPQGTRLAAGQRLIIVANLAAFEFRYGPDAAIIAGEYSGQLRNSGEQIRLQGSDTATIADFTYGDGNPWPESADGDGYSLVYSGADPSLPLDWRTSLTAGGSPGEDDGEAFTGTGEEIIAYALASTLKGSLIGDSFSFSFRQKLSGDDAFIIAEYSTKLTNWIPLSSDNLTSRVNQGNGTSLVTYTSPLPPSTGQKQFARLRLISR
jgi:hypothetical protein